MINKAVHTIFILSTTLVVANVQAREIARQITLGSIQSDWNGDGKIDKAILVTRDNKQPAATLLVYLSNKSKNLNRKLEAHDIVWHSGYAGQGASLKLNKRNSIVIYAGNTSVGRHRWRSKLTIVYRRKISGRRLHITQTRHTQTKFSHDL